MPGERFAVQMRAKNAHDWAVAKTCSAGVPIAQRGSGEGGSCSRRLLMCSPPIEASWDSRPSMAANVFPSPGQLRASALLEPLTQVYWPGLPVSSNQSRPSTDNQRMKVMLRGSPKQQQALSSNKKHTTLVFI